MSQIYAISVYALLRHESFATMIRSIFEQEVGVKSMEDFLVKLRHASDYEHKQNRHASDYEHKRNNQDERHWLQKLVDNGQQLVHAEEAKLNKLVEAHQKKNDCQNKYYQKIVMSVIGFISL